MSRYECRIFFESLCRLRRQYADRGDDDATSCISLADAIALANRLEAETSGTMPADASFARADVETN
jgi:hypothetical protein